MPCCCHGDGKLTWHTGGLSYGKLLLPCPCFSSSSVWSSVQASPPTSGGVCEKGISYLIKTKACEAKPHSFLPLEHIHVRHDAWTCSGSRLVVMRGKESITKSRGLLTALCCWGYLSGTSWCVPRWTLDVQSCSNWVFCYSLTKSRFHYTIFEVLNTEDSVVFLWSTLCLPSMLVTTDSVWALIVPVQMCFTVLMPKVNKVGDLCWRLSPQSLVFSVPGAPHSHCSVTILGCIQEPTGKLLHGSNAAVTLPPRSARVKRFWCCQIFLRLLVIGSCHS